jgi:methylthioribulose-1-phosphate dehydratase
MSTLVLQQELLEVIRYFHSRHWAPATSANYSFRNPAPESNHFTISRSGVDKALFQLSDFMEVDAAGLALEPYSHLKPSAETLLHTLLYENPDVHAVLHTHSVANTVYTYRRRQKAVEMSGFEVLKGISGVQTHETTLFLPVFENAQDMVALRETIRDTMPEYPGVPGFLLAGHGLYAWGRSIAEAKRHIEVFEFILECLERLEK